MDDQTKIEIAMCDAALPVQFYPELSPDQRVKAFVQLARDLAMGLDGILKHLYFVAGNAADMSTVANIAQPPYARAIQAGLLGKTEGANGNQP